MPSTYTIQSTKDYSAFTGVLGNRTVRPAHVKKIRTAIEKDPESIKYNPLLVNEHMAIIDGQHRREAIHALIQSDVAFANLEYYYVQVPGLTLQDVQKLNSVAKQWQPIDYAMAFSKLGNENYSVYLSIKHPDGVYQDLSINHDSLLRYLSFDRPISPQMFVEGGLVVTNLERSLELLTQLHDFRGLYERYTIRSFALAFLRIALHPDYDHKQMMEQAKNYRHKFLIDYAKEQDYVKALNKLFNHMRGEKRKKTLVDSSYFINN